MSVKKTYEYATTVTSSSTVNTDNDDYLVDATSGNITLTLPSASATGMKGKIFTFRRIDTSSNIVTIAAAGSDTIIGLASVLLNTVDVIKIIRYSTTSWRYLMESTKLCSFTTLSTLAPTVNASFDVNFLDTSANTVSAVLPLAATLPLGYKITFNTTSAANAATVAPGAGDSSAPNNGAVALSNGSTRTYIVTGSTSWRYI